MITEAKKRIPSANPTECYDLLTIVFGRVLVLAEVEPIEAEHEQELQEIARYASDLALATQTEEIRTAALDILRYLPMRSANEVQFLLQQAESANEPALQQAYLEAIKFARPATPAAWVALEQGKQTLSPAVVSVVEELLKRRK